MRADAESRLKFINLMVKSIEDEVSLAWENMCSEFQTEQASLVDSVLDVFTYKREYFPVQRAERYKKFVLRKTAKELHTELVPEFEAMYLTFQVEYTEFKRKFKTMLAEVCRVALSPDDFAKVIPPSILNLTGDTAYIPLRTAKGWNDDNLKKFIDSNTDTLEKAKFYLSIRQLI